MKTSITLIFIAICALSTGAIAQNDLKTTAQSVCPTASEVTHVHLYGLWRAEWSDGAAPAELQLARHPEMAESVRGSIRRDGTEAQVAGDVDNGDFTLEESDNGHTISATWIGQVVEGACGKEIRGTWTNANTSQERSFVLRKQPGWH